MAIFTGQLLYPRNVDQDQVWGSNVKALISTASADTDWTVTFTSETTITQTVVPYTNTSNDPSDTRNNNGWAVNQDEASTDGMGSIVERTRFVPTGDWVFSIPIAYTAPALLANYDIQAEFSIYRVATGGGTRALLFSTTSNTVTVNLQAGTNTLTASSTQPEVVIGVGETIHYAIRLTSVATTATLGNVTSTVVTLQGTTSGGMTLTLPAQGIRSRYFEYSDGVGNTFTPVDIFIKKDIESQGEGAGIINRLVEFYRELNGGGEGDGERSLLTVLKTLVSGGEAQGTSLRLIEKAPYTATGLVSGLRLPNSIFKDVIVADGDAESTISRVVTFARLFEGTGEGSESFNKVVIFVRTFNADGESIIKPRICLDWDDLPVSGTVIAAPETGQLVYFDWE